MITAAHNPLSELDPHDITGTWTTRGLDRITDAALLHAACRLLSTPRDEAANSFTLHAPLELMARAQLLPMVSTRRRESARQRIALIAATWSTTGTPTDPADDIAPVGQPLDASEKPFISEIPRRPIGHSSLSAPEETRIRSSSTSSTSCFPTSAAPPTAQYSWSSFPASGRPD